MRTVLRAPNAASIRVTYPDGCRATWTTRPDSIIAANILPFANWLRELADEIEEAASTEGRCAR